MNNISKALLVGVLALGTAACDEFLDVNTNPNAPEQVRANMYLPPMIHWMATSPQYDGRQMARLSQEWVIPQTSGSTPNTWERHGFDNSVGSLDAHAQQWRDVYWNFGWNLIDMMRIAEAEERWDVLGIGYVLKAWGWLALTTYHGEIIVQEAFTPDKYYFKYDTQEFVYQEVVRLLDQAIEALQRTDGKIEPAFVAIGDRLFNGDKVKWLKYAYGLKALALNHYSNKSNYDPNAVIAAVDQSLASGAEDVLFPYPNTATDNSDRNFWGTTRGNMGTLRQTKFILELLNGTAYPGAADPRLSRMLSPSPDGAYRGVDPNLGYNTFGSVAERPNNLWGYASTGAPGATDRGRYLFDDRAKFPLMTYAQLQFVKAEAALRKGDQATAKQAYLNGINAHFDFVNARTSEVGNSAVTLISATDRAAFLANPAVNPATLTLSHIMGQKFIAQWGWGHQEIWMDMRRFHYTDMDPVSGTQVFRGFTLPNNFYPDNNGKTAQRVRPRYNSDYVWNRAELDKIGGLAPDYHTKPMWITER